MALGSFAGGGGSGGEFAARIEYNAKAGRFFRVDRENIGGEYQTDKVEITDGFAAIFDLANIEVGWAHYPPQSAPSMVFGPPDAPPPRPNEDHKAAIRVRMKLSPTTAGGKEAIREFVTSAIVARGALDVLHDAYLAAPEAAQGKLPVVGLRGAPAPVSGKHGTNYEPRFVITGWKDRPDDLKAPQAKPAAKPAAAASGPPATGSTQARQPEPEPAGADW